MGTQTRHKVGQRQGLSDSCMWVGEAPAPPATFPMLPWGRARLRDLDRGFPLERKRNSLEATKALDP